jgi:hypothetical protein
LDLYCGAGGCARGYTDAGFDVTGVDIIARPNYPYRFRQADALTFLRAQAGGFDVIHASPPCQVDCALTRGTNASRGWGRDHGQQVIPTLRRMLDRTGLPYVIEQPHGRAPIRQDIVLCGEMFSLGVIRHRVFELGRWKTSQPDHVPHRGRVRGWRHGVYHDGPYVAAYGAGGAKASVIEMQSAMGIDWTDVRDELTEAIPPAYTRWLGAALMRY